MPFLVGQGHDTGVLLWMKGVSVNPWQKGRNLCLPAPRVDGRCPALDCLVVEQMNKGRKLSKRKSFRKLGNDERGVGNWGPSSYSALSSLDLS